jgi:hypothetical protein
MRHVNRWLSLVRVVFWIVMIPVAFVLGWASSVPFVAFISLWALVETAFSAYRADSPS